MAESKICGLKDAEAAGASVASGARWLGYNFFPKSPRYITPQAAAGLHRLLAERAESVAVTVNAEDALLGEIAAALAPDWVQLHGAESPARARDARRFARRGIIKALPIATAADLEAAASFAGAADFLLLDAKAPPGAALTGGNGVAFDWRILAGWSAPLPWFLSGGLTPENVKDAISISGAERVDVSSGVERAPGLKDTVKIKAFLAAARAAA